MELTQNTNNIVWTISSTGNEWTVTRFISGAGASVGGINQGFSGARIVLGIENALPTTVRVQWSSNNGNITGGTLDLAGFDQTVAGLDKPAVYPNEDTVPHSIPVIINSSAASDATLTLSGLVTDYIFTGLLSDGPANRLSLVLDSAGRTQSLTRAGTYTGNTTIRNGTLSVASPNFADASTLTINGDGVLNLPSPGSPDVVASLIIDGNPVHRCCLSCRKQQRCHHRRRIDRRGRRSATTTVGSRSISQASCRPNPATTRTGMA